MLRSIARAWRISAKATDTKGRALAFLLAIHAGLGEHRRWARRIFRGLIGCFGERGLVTLAIRIDGRLVRLAMRQGDRADYLVGGEFLHGSHVAPPTQPARVVDAGGNIGTFSLAAAARFPGVPMVVYEPDEANVARLKENLRMNGIEAQVVQKAVWSKDATLFFQARDSYTGFVSGEPSKVRVECVLPDVRADDWLKLDVEGAEYEVLPALFERGSLPYFISLELHHRRERGDALIALVRAHGYTVDGPLDPSADCVNLTLARIAR